MRKKVSLCLAAALLLSLLSGCVRQESLPGENAGPEGQGKVVLYAAMREEALQALAEGFEEKYPNVELEYYNAATKTVVSRILSEGQVGQVAADVLWVGDARDCEKFKDFDILKKYPYDLSEGAIDESFQDPEGYYTVARVAAMGLVVNTDLIPSARKPKTWMGMVDPDWNGRIAVVDPSLSAAADYWACAILNSDHSDYGDYYIRRLKRSQCHLESSFASLLQKVKAGERAIGVCPDYLAAEFIEEGGPITFVYPTDTVAVGTPLALVEGSANAENGQLLYDYLLSKEGQKIMADHGLVSVRNDVEQRSTPDAIAAMAMVCDVKVMSANRDKNLATFNEILGV